MADGLNRIVHADSELKCGICLELFQDPRSLPCLHTFCRECIQRSLNENHSLKCPLCRAKHQLTCKGAELLPVNEYALQELPLRRLQQQQREDNSGQQQCKSCRKQGPLIAWCKDCDAMICQHCVLAHKSITALQCHSVVSKGDNEPTASSQETYSNAKCPRHARVELKYVCTPCSELVCSECLLVGSHKDHQFSLIEEVRHSLETKMEELASLLVEKKKEFNEYLEKAGSAEGKALEYSELMKSEVNNVFDGIVASVEAQRNEALQSVSQGVKEIWSQKEKVEVSLAQLDSFTRFADHTHKCMSNTSYVAMATQGIKLMKRLKDTHGDETALDYKIIPLGSQCSKGPLHVPLDTVFALGQPLSLKFLPAPGSEINESNPITIRVSLMVGGLPVIYSPAHENYQLVIEAIYWSKRRDGENETIISPQVKLVQSRELLWEINFEMSYKFVDNFKLEVKCKVLADSTVGIIASDVATFIIFESVILYYSSSDED